jgi:hypothetical protein
MYGLPVIREELVGTESQNRSRYADFAVPIRLGRRSNSAAKATIAFGLAQGLVEVLLRLLR